VTTLPAADARKLFAGVPDLPAAATPTTPPVQAPRPRATRVIVPTSRAAPLPPRVSGARGPLRILRRQPEGEVTTIAVVSVTFSEPMRALDQQPAAPPVRLTPAVDGAWRWVDAQTARFEPAQALPFATAFEVVVPAGTAAVSGTRLPDEVRWAFRTPPPKLAELDFHEVAEAEPLVWLVFDQPVDQAEVLQHLRVTRDGEAIAARVAEVAEDQRVWSVRELALDRWLAVRVAAGTGDWERLRVELTAGMPGKVGTLRTAAVQGFEKVRERPVLQRVCREDVPQGDPSGVVRCDVEKVCTPVRTGPHAGTQVCQRTLGLQFAPALDPTTLRPGVASCDPPVALQDWQHRYGDESLSGVFEVGKRYRLVFGPELRSEEGRRAGKVQEVLLEVEPEEPSVSVNLYAGSVGQPDPNAKVEITARNATAVDVELRRVEADELWKRGADALPSESRWSREEMKAWKKAWNEAQRKAGREVPPEPTPVWRGRVPLTAGAYGSLRASVPLAPALRDGRGVVVVRATVPGTDVEAESWAVFTNLDVSIRQDGTQWVARVWNRDTGRPSPAALLRTGAPEWTWLRTDRDGFARMRHAYGDMLVVSTERDFAIFEPSVFSACTNIVEGFPAENQWLWHVVDDRGLYRPGDTVRLAGWARQLERGPQGGLRMPDGRPATWVLRGPRHDEVGKGEVALDRNGAFRFEVVLPVDADPGRWSVVLVPPEDETEKDPWDRWRRREPNHAHALQVAEFVRPAFEVTATLSDGPFVTGERAVASLRSGYLAQGGLAEAEVSWALALADKQQRRWQADGFLFGDHGDRYATHDEVELPQSATLLQARTDAHGEHRLALDLADAAPGLPSNLVLQATVLDANRKGRSTQPLELRVHPARVQVGLRATAEGSKKSGRLRVETRVVDLVGAILPGRPVSVQVQPLVQREGAWEPGEPQTCQVASAAAPVACAFRVAPCSRQRI
jgi:hypothetical protein